MTSVIRSTIDVGTPGSPPQRREATTAYLANTTTPRTRPKERTRTRSAHMRNGRIIQARTARITKVQCIPDGGAVTRKGPVPKANPAAPRRISTTLARGTLMDDPESGKVCLCGYGPTHHYHQHPSGLHTSSEVGITNRVGASEGNNKAATKRLATSASMCAVRASIEPRATTTDRAERQAYVAKQLGIRDTRAAKRAEQVLIQRLAREEDEARLDVVIQAEIKHMMARGIHQLPRIQRPAAIREHRTFSSGRVNKALYADALC